MPSEQMQRKAQTKFMTSCVHPACYDWLFDAQKSEQVAIADVW